MVRVHSSAPNEPFSGEMSYIDGMHFRSLLTLSILAGSAATFALTRRDDVTEPDFAAAANNFKAVGLLTYSNNTSDKRTVILIGDKFILTAAHNMPATGVTASVQINGLSYITSAWVKHPNFNASDLTNGYDVSVARLNQRVTNVKPFPLYTASTEQNRLCEIVGFGGLGTGTSGSNSFPWTVHAGTNLVDMDSTLPRVLFTDFDKPGDSSFNSLSSIGSSATATVLECQVAPGDSGGPLLIKDGTIWKVAGVASAAGAVSGTVNSGYGNFSLFTRVSPIAAWIKDKAWENGRVSGNIATSDYTASPEFLPATFEIRSPGSTTPLETDQVTLATDGGFSFVTNLRGTFDISVKVNHWLRKVWHNVTITNNVPDGLTQTVINGDVNNDNEVGPGDFGILSGVYGTVQGDPNYYFPADLDGDSEIGPADFGILSSSYGLAGED